MAALLVGGRDPDGGFQGPLPLWGWLPGGWGGCPLNAFAVDAHAHAIQKAVDRPAGVRGVGDQRRRARTCPARQRIQLFPKLEDAQWVLSRTAPSRAMARDRPTLRIFGPPRPSCASERRSREWGVSLPKEEHPD